MARFYLIMRPTDTRDWFPVCDLTNERVETMDLIDAVFCATIMTKTLERRVDGTVIAEAVIANVETGEQVGKFERTAQLDLLKEPRNG